MGGVQTVSETHFRCKESTPALVERHVPCKNSGVFRVFPVMGKSAQVIVKGPVIQTALFAVERSVAEKAEGGRSVKVSAVSAPP